MNKVKSARILAFVLGLLSIVFSAVAQEESVLLPQFSTPGGWQKAAVSLTLSCGQSGAEIFYTLDGSAPKLQYDASSKKTVAVADVYGVTARRYTEPIAISKTTPVSAVCVGADGTVGLPVSQTYLFLDDILQQPARIDGYPDGWSYSGSGESASYFAADYEMDPDICFSKDYKNLMSEAFMSLGSMCVVTAPGALFSHDTDEETGGIYIHTGKSPGSYGDGWERPASLEFYDPERDKSFQVNCGLLLHGGNSRNPSNSPKHSFRVSFRAKYGASKLKYKMFPKTDAVKKFDHLVLRAGYNYTWIVNGSKSLYANKIIQREHAQYIIDAFAKNLQMAMGQPGVHDRFVHLFINGLYWGLYDVSEKINNDFVQAYLGGKDEDYDVVGDHNETIDGTRTVYEKMYAAAVKVGTSADDENYKYLIDNKLLDMDNFIDYMLLNWYIGNEDWDSNNWRCARSVVDPGEGFSYFVWDAETALTWDSKENLPNPFNERVSKVSGDPSRMMQALRNHPEFKLLAADRIHAHFFNGGPLSEAGAAALYDSLARVIALPIIAESARWGDYRKDVTLEATDVYTRNGFWYPSWQLLMSDYFPDRTASVMEELVDYGLYPKVDAPNLSLRSGFYVSDELKVTAKVSDIYGDETLSKSDLIYYTLDGSDPRVAYTSAVKSGALKYSGNIAVKAQRAHSWDTVAVTVKARNLRGNVWSALEEVTYHLVPRSTALTAPSAEELRVRAAHGRLSVTGASEALTLTLYLPDGREVYRTPYAQLPDASWDVSHLSPGLYIYRIESAAGGFSGKIKL